MPAIIKAEPEAVAFDLEPHRAHHHRHAARLPRAGRLRRERSATTCRCSRAAVAPLPAVLGAARAAGMLVIHTREGHRPDLSDAPRRRSSAAIPSMRIGAPGPMGRILVRGEPGHDIIPELYPVAGEPVIDKPGKGAFYQTDLDADAAATAASSTLLVCGVTTEVCVHTTVREANDRGYRCIVLADCCASYFPEFHEIGLEMIKAQGGIFGWVSHSRIGAALARQARRRTETSSA